MIHSIFEYLRSRQTPKIRVFHIVVLLMAVSQIIVSNFIGFTGTGEIKRNAVNFYGTLTHIGTGLTLLPIALIFTFLLLKEHGLRYFFPYIFGDLKQVKMDIKKLLNFKLPDPEARGLSTIVEGLGLGALFLALLSGLTWFISWRLNAPWAPGIKNLHKLIVGLIELYIIGHGAMGLLHIYFYSRGKTDESETTQ